jgi:hypothetical protein
MPNPEEAAGARLPQQRFMPLGAHRVQEFPLSVHPTAVAPTERANDCFVTLQTLIPTWEHEDAKSAEFTGIDRMNRLNPTRICLEQLSGISCASL